MILVDDLHWADRASLPFLEFLVKAIARCPLLLIGMYRDVDVSREHPLSQTLGTLVREQHFQRIQLLGLPKQEVAEFVKDRTGVTFSLSDGEILHGRTEGNPLFLN